MYGVIRNCNFCFTPLSRIFRDNLSRIFTRPPKTLGEKYFLAGPKPVETFRPNRPGASRVTQKPGGLGWTG